MAESFSGVEPSVTPLAMLVAILALLFGISHYVGKSAEAARIAEEQQKAEREVTTTQRVNSHIAARALASQEKRKKREAESQRMLEENLTEDTVRTSWEQRHEEEKHGNDHQSAASPAPKNSGRQRSTKAAATADVSEFRGGGEWEEEGTSSASRVEVMGEGWRNGLKQCEINGHGASALHTIELAIREVQASPLTARSLLVPARGIVDSSPGATAVLAGCGFVAPCHGHEEWRFEGSLALLPEVIQGLQSSINACDEQWALSERRVLVASQELEYAASLEEDRRREPPAPKPKRVRKPVSPEPPPGGPRIVEVSVALQGGTARRRFEASAPVSAIYDWLYEHANASSDAGKLEEDEDLQLECSFPRRDLVDSAETLEECGLQGRTRLVGTIVEKSDDDEPGDRV